MVKGDEANIMRGLTAIPDPKGGTGEVLIGTRTNPGVVETIDSANNHGVTVDLGIKAFFAKAFGVSDYRGPALSAYNRVVPFTHPDTGEKMLLIGVWVNHPDSKPPNNGSYFLVRRGNGTYEYGSIFDIANPLPAGETLKGTRTIAVSPFAEDKGRVLYFGGHDCAGQDSHNTAWVYRGELGPARQEGVKQPAEQAKSALPDRYLCVMVLDACRPDYLTLAPMPNLNEMISKGVTYENAWVGQLLNNTPPGHASIAHGVLPVHSGINGFGWLDETLGKRVNPTGWEAVCNGNVGVILRKNNCPAQGDRPVRDRRIGQFAQVLCGSLDGGILVRHHRFSGERRRGGAHREEKEQGGAVGKKGAKNKTVAFVKGKAPCEAVVKQETLNKPTDETSGDNAYGTELVIAVLKNHKPRVMFINLPETDGLGHRCGGINRPDLVKPLMEQTDKLLGRIFQAYRDLGIFEKTVFVITSDHGMIPHTGTIDTAEADAKLKELTGKRRGVMTSAFIQEAEDVPKVAEALAGCNVKGIHAVYYKTKKDGKYAYEIASAYMDKLPADLDAAYRYLLGTVANECGAQVFAMSAEHHGFSADKRGMGGSHQAVMYNDQHVPLIISGPGVKAGTKSDYPARLVDIAPTMLALFGVHAKNLDGIILADALQQADEAAVKAQDERKPDLLRMVSALQTRSEDLKAIGK
jgi:arylsulfatase A-like enzyme